MNLSQLYTCPACQKPLMSRMSPLCNRCGAKVPPELLFSKEEGTWSIESDVILMKSKTRTKDFSDTSAFVTAYAHKLLPKREGFSRLLVNADHPEHIVMKKTPKPTQSTTAQRASRVAD